jgi:hypothetical protein
MWWLTMICDDAGNFSVFSEMWTVLFARLQEEEAHFMRLVSVLHDLLVCKTATREKRDELQT